MCLSDLCGFAHCIQDPIWNLEVVLAFRSMTLGVTWMVGWRVELVMAWGFEVGVLLSQAVCALGEQDLVIVMYLAFGIV